MEIKRMSNENMGKKEIWKLTNSRGAAGLKEAVGTVITVSEWVNYLDDDGENTSEVLSLLTPEGEVLATTSKTFIESFIKAWDFFDGEEKNFRVISKVSKNNREYLDCDVE